MPDAAQPRPLPGVTDETRPFWEALARGRLVVQACARCGYRQHPPRPFCLRCLSEDLTWLECGGAGEVHAFTVVRRAPHPALESRVPYVLALVDLPEGFRVLAGVAVADPAEVAVGAAVELDPEPAGDGVSLLRFRLRR
jgi:uncharacterized OB-fold protein